MKFVHSIAAITISVVVCVGAWGNDALIIGQLITSSIVVVNEKTADNGASIFNNSHINVKCLKGETIVNLDRLGRIELGPGADMILKFSDGLISGTLDMGTITVRAEKGVKVSIATPNGIITSSAENQSQIIPISAQRGVRCAPLAITGFGSPAFGPFGMALVGIGAGGAALAGAMAIDQDPSSKIIVPQPKIVPQASNTIP